MKMIKMYWNYVTLCNCFQVGNKNIINIIQFNVIEKKWLHYQGFYTPAAGQVNLIDCYFPGIIFHLSPY